LNLLVAIVRNWQRARSRVAVALYVPAFKGHVQRVDFPAAGCASASIGLHAIDGFIEDNLGLPPRVSGAG
ncbi:hypothetical protein, partial [Pseudomonas protegens]|uniref:hypothetical protein n=1 Tax=Pseudomonas protegens TaxID=380021 RepID=UPI001C84054A